VKLQLIRTGAVDPVWTPPPLCELKRIKVMQHVSRQQIGKHAPTTIERLLKAVFPVGSAPGLYNEDLRPGEVIERVQCSVESRAVENIQKEAVMA
jgi:hypothetical protein